jgi:putative heme-binding domain-containing protein
MRLFGLLPFLFLALAQGPAWSEPATDIERGKKLFRSNCAGCHGIDGGGGSGPSLARPKLKRAADDAELVELIVAGIPKAGMPSSWYLLPDGPRQLAAYVRSLSKVSDAPVAGDAGHGRAVFEGSGCAGCHIVRGAGRALGPELTDIGARRTPEFLRRTIANPAETIPEGFVMVRAEMAGGGEVRGIRLNEDSFTIQLKDESGAFHSFRKAEVVKLEKLAGRTPMPAYGGLPATDLQDLIAYLASLRGEE